jgi:hypothetical protein
MIRFTISIDFNSNERLNKIHNLLSDLKRNNSNIEVVRLDYRNENGETFFHSSEGSLVGGFDDFGCWNFEEDFSMDFPNSYRATININIEKEDVEKINEDLFKLKEVSFIIRVASVFRYEDEIYHTEFKKESTTENTYDWIEYLQMLGYVEI